MKIPVGFDNVLGTVFSVLACVLAGAPAVAWAVPVADVTVSVVVTPSAFTPMSTGVIELVMHNNGPDAAGTAYPGSLGNLITQRAFLLDQPTDPTPYAVLPGTTGCGVGFDVVGPNVNLLWGYIWSFHFSPIPPGESRTCRIPIQLGPKPFESFATSWRIATNPEDPDLSNNAVAYQFISGTPLAPDTPVPGLPHHAQWALIAALAAAAGYRLRSSQTTPSFPLQGLKITEIISRR